MYIYTSMPGESALPKLSPSGHVSNLGFTVEPRLLQRLHSAFHQEAQGHHIHLVSLIHGYSSLWSIPKIFPLEPHSRDHLLYRLGPSACLSMAPANSMSIFPQEHCMRATGRCCHITCGHKNDRRCSNYRNPETISPSPSPSPPLHIETHDLSHTNI